MKRTFVFLLFLVWNASAYAAEKPKSLFYLTSDSTSLHSFLDHLEKVDIVVPTWYSVNSEGLVSGAPNPLVLETARQHHVVLMPIVVNGGFVQAEFHKFLGDAAAQKRMLEALIRECKENKYIGIQFD